MSTSGGRPVIGLTPGAAGPDGGVKVVVVSPNGSASRPVMASQSAMK